MARGSQPQCWRSLVCLTIAFLVHIEPLIGSCTAYPEPPRPLLVGNLLAMPSPAECGVIVHILTSEGFQ
jgi:hypothetical protein